MNFPNIDDFLQLWTRAHEPFAAALHDSPPGERYDYSQRDPYFDDLGSVSCRRIKKPDGTEEGLIIFRGENINWDIAYSWDGNFASYDFTDLRHSDTVRLRLIDMTQVERSINGLPQSQIDDMVAECKRLGGRHERALTKGDAIFAFPTDEAAVEFRLKH